MIVLLNGVDEATLQELCDCAATGFSSAGVVLTKEGPKGELLFWSLRSHVFEPFNEESRIWPYLKLGRAHTIRNQKGGQFALWLRPHFNWYEDAVISRVLLESSGQLVVLPNGEKLPVEAAIDLRKRLELIEARAKDVLRSLCGEECGHYPSEQIRELNAQHLVDDTGKVAPAIRNILLEMLPM